MSSNNNSLGIQRGNYQWSLSGPLLLVLGRLACIPLQYAIVTHHPLSVLGIPQRSIDLSFWPAALPPPPPPLLIFLATTGILIAKQSIWVFGICNEYMTVPFALFGVLADFFYEGVSALVFTVPGDSLLLPLEEMLANLITIVICDCQRFTEYII
ncbi:hypothetical protein BU25DRAFT_491257 [Macroventuria anomochaeta]|uniref:Uncharacterized protein n=1 Tax=Macroventuria anomochaeta TaxID=301207 RepID=A0ACB6S1W9_9PLEO|nr:uncharacterized protein BU25DRAFT_491257 [Macroventuria anomochaeta]KAF2627640.1 hypothetical protein BU25DRAFT_491257 [Macroventuria anomochaeta]